MKQIEAARGAGGFKDDKDGVNIISIYGSMPGENVKAKSSLASEFRQHLINKTMNYRSECKLPYDFTDFRACNG